MFYPLVNIQKAMESHHFWWENPLFLWPFSIAKCYSHYQVSWLIRWYPWWFSIHCPSVLQPDRYIQYIYSPCDVQSQAYGYYIYITIYIYAQYLNLIYTSICIYIYNSCSPWHQVVSYQSLFQRYWRLGHAEALRFRGTPRFRRRGIQRFPMKNPDLSDKNMIIVKCPGFVTCSKNMMILMSIFRWF